MQKKLSIEQISKIYSGWFKKLQLSGKDHDNLLSIIIRASRRYLGISEKWKQIPEYEGLYQVSNFGRIKSCGKYVSHWRGGLMYRNQRILKTAFDRTGYEVVVLCKHGLPKMYKLHVLLAKAFLNHNPEKNKIGVQPY